MADRHITVPSKGPLAGLLVWTAEIVSLAGIAAFAIALGLNWFVFSQWNLNFLQIASISDVLTSGLTIALLVGTVIGPVSAGLFSGLFIGRRFEGWRSRRRALAAITAGAITLAFSVVVYIVLKNPQSQRLELLMPWTGADAIITTSLLLFVMSFTMNISTFGTIPEGDALLRVLLISSFALIVTMASGLALVGEIGRLQSNGFVGGYFAEVEACPDPGTARVLWIGERAVVYRCDINQQELVELEPEGRTLKRIARH